MMNIGLILNYNNYNETIECTYNLKKSSIDKIVIVDNNSKNNSLNILHKEFKYDDNIVIISAYDNKGYAAGNNLGLRYIYKNYHYNDNVIVFVVNPDVRIDSDIVIDISEFILKNKNNVGAVTGLINGTSKSAWHHMTKCRAFIFNFLVFRWVLFKLNIKENKSYKLSNKDSNKIKVDVVVGAFFGIDLHTFNSVNFFDESTFLYYEEEALYAKLSSKFQNFLITNKSFHHKGRSSTNINKLKFKEINDKSRMTILRKYYSVGKFYQTVSQYVNKIDNKILILLHR